MRAGALAGLLLAGGATAQSLTFNAEIGLEAGVWGEGHYSNVAGGGAGLILSERLGRLGGNIVLWEDVQTPQAYFPGADEIPISAGLQYMVPLPWFEEFDLRLGAFGTAAVLDQPNAYPGLHQVTWLVGGDVGVDLGFARSYRGLVEFRCSRAVSDVSNAPPSLYPWMFEGLFSVRVDVL